MSRLRVRKRQRSAFAASPAGLAAGVGLLSVALYVWRVLAGRSAGRRRREMFGGSREAWDAATQKQRALDSASPPLETGSAVKRELRDENGSRYSMAFDRTRKTPESPQQKSDSIQIPTGLFAASKLEWDHDDALDAAVPERGAEARVIAPPEPPTPWTLFALGVQAARRALFDGALPLVYVVMLCWYDQQIRARQAELDQADPGRADTYRWRVLVSPADIPPPKDVDRWSEHLVSDRVHSSPPPARFGTDSFNPFSLIGALSGRRGASSPRQSKRPDELDEGCG